jgi:hypothetical protein
MLFDLMLQREAIYLKFTCAQSQPMYEHFRRRENIGLITFDGILAHLTSRQVFGIVQVKNHPINIGILNEQLKCVFRRFICGVSPNHHLVMQLSRVARSLAKAFSIILARWTVVVE